MRKFINLIKFNKIAEVAFPLLAVKAAILSLFI